VLLDLTIGHLTAKPQASLVSDPIAVHPPGGELAAIGIGIAENQPLLVLQASAVAHGKNIPFLAILGLYRAYFGITPQDDDRGARP
jgi:hypothetical protein